MKLTSRGLPTTDEPLEEDVEFHLKTENTDNDINDNNDEFEACSQTTQETSH